MAELLKREGYEPLVASDYDSAVLILENDDADAAVVDIIMPRRDGIDLLKQIAARETYLPVIMITGEPNLDRMPEIIRAGAYDFISKPVHKESLLHAVGRAVEKKRLADEKRELEQQIRLYAQQLEQRVEERTRELAKAHNFLNTVLDSSTEYAMVAADCEGRVTLFNRGAEIMLGYNEEQAVGRAASGFLVENNPAGPESLFSRIEMKGSHGEEIEMRRSDNSTFYASATVTPIRESGGEHIGYLAIIKDLTTERRDKEHIRQMRERLAHNEKIAALGRMAAQVAHEVKNPLAGLRLYSMHLRGKVAGKLAANELALIDKIIDGITQLTDVADRVLNFARPITLAPRRADLNEIIAKAIPMLEPQLTAKGIDVELRLMQPGAYGMFDESAMRSVAMNLMLNSIQAMSEGGRLIVSTLSREGRVEFAVRDSGCGMTEEQSRNVFEPFYTTKSQGLGLGMSFVAKVIEGHGGSVAISSAAGQGTDIKITLPGEESGADEASRANSGGR
jgi:PAS domain S-box-containing protein